MVMEEEQPSVAAHMQVAMHELRQHQEGLSSALRSGWWTTAEGKQILCDLNQEYRQLIDTMTERCRRLLNPQPGAVIAPTPLSSSSREELVEGEAAAGEVVMLEEVTGTKGFCSAGAHSEVSRRQCFSHLALK